MRKLATKIVSRQQKSAEITTLRIKYHTVCKITQHEGSRRKSQPSHSSHDLLFALFEICVKFCSAVVIYAVLSQDNFCRKFTPFWVENFQALKSASVKKRTNIRYDDTSCYFRHICDSWSIREPSSPLQILSNCCRNPSLPVHSSVSAVLGATHYSK